MAGEIYVVQMTSFDYGGYESVTVSHHTYNEYYLTKEDAQKCVEAFDKWKLDPSVGRTEYHIQTLWQEAPRIVIKKEEGV